MSNFTFCGNEIDVTRIKNDVNGNPRYVIHFLAVYQHKLAKAYKETFITKAFDTGYDFACLLGNRAGFKRFHNKQYGGGLVFQSYNVQQDLNNLERAIDDYLNDFYFIEVTDTFAGECNYCWLHRYLVYAKNSRQAMLKVAKYEGYAVRRDGWRFVGKNACIAIYQAWDESFTSAVNSGSLKDYKLI